MEKKSLKGSIYLLIAAIFWGSAFVAQDQVVLYLAPFTANGLRFLVAAVLMIPVAIIWDKFNYKHISRSERRDLVRHTIIGGIACGITLAIASSFQQVGLVYTTPGKSGFITALYIVLVPIAGIFVGKKQPLRIWLCLIGAVVAMFLLGVESDLSFNIGDLLTIICAFGYAANIIVVGKYAQGTDCMLLSLVQMLVAGILCMIPAFIFEGVQSGESLIAGAPYVLYIAVFSCCVAYTCQILGQRDTPEALASVLMSMESVFSLIFQVIILGDMFSLKESIGAILMLTCVIVAQLEPKQKSIQ